MSCLCTSWPLIWDCPASRGLLVNVYQLALCAGIQDLDLECLPMSVVRILAPWLVSSSSCELWRDTNNQLPRYKPAPAQRCLQVSLLPPTLPWRTGLVPWDTLPTPVCPALPWPCSSLTCLFLEPFSPSTASSDAPTHTHTSLSSCFTWLAPPPSESGSLCQHSRAHTPVSAALFVFSDTPCFVRTHVLLPHSTSSLSPIDGKLCGDRKSIFFLCVLSRSHRTWHAVCATYTLAKQLCSHKALCSYCCCLVTKSCATLLWLQRLWPIRLFCQWNFLGKNTWVVFSPSRGSSPLGDQTHVLCTGRQDLYHWATREAQKALLLSFSHSVCLTLCDPMDSSTPEFLVLHYLLEFAQTQVHWTSVAIQPSSLSSPSPPAFNLSSIWVFSNESALPIRWPKYWSFSIRSSKEYSGLIFLKIDWSDLLAFHGTLKSLYTWSITFKNFESLYYTSVTHSVICTCSLPDSSIHAIFLSKNAGVGCHFLLQGIFPTQGSNSCLPRCRQTLHYLSYQGIPGNI